MTKQDILNTTGLSEEEFYQRYPDQETFCSDYPEMCPDMMDDEDVSDEYVVESDYDNSLYEAEDGVQTTAPYTDYNQYQKAMQTYGAESNKASTYNSFQNDLYNQSGKTRGSSETTSQLGDMFNTLSPEQQDALAQKYGAQFITNTPSANRRNYVNSMEMTVPGKGTGYYSFPTNDVVYGSKDLERPNYEFSKMTAPQYKMPATPPVKNSFQPAQIINNIGASYKDPASLNASNGNLPIPKHSLNSTMKKVGATNQPFVTSTPSYSSIVDLLKARKLDSSFANRKKLAEEAGIKNYTGSASQNMDFINKMDNFNPYSTEMELGGENMFVNGGLVKYQKKGEVKENPPKEFTDFKKFQRAERLYKDSLDTYNNFPAFDKNMSALYNNMMPNVTTEDNYQKLRNEFAEKYIKSAKKNKINLNILKENKKEDKKYKLIKATGNNGEVITEYMTTDFAVKPKQPVVFKPTRVVDNLERMEIIPYTFNNPIGAPHGELLPIPPKQTVNLTNLTETRTHPIDIYDRRGNFLRTEFMGDAEGVVNHKYIGEHHYAPRGINSFIDTNFKNGGLIKYKNKGEVKQNPPKVYTDKKMFEQAKKLYADSLFLHNNPVVVDNYFPKAMDLDLNKHVASSFKSATSPFGGTYDVHPIKKINKKILNDLINDSIKDRTVPDYGDDLEIFERNKKRNKTLIESILKMKKTGFQPVASTEPSYFGQTMFFKKPVQPVVFQSAPTHPIEHLERLEMISPSLNGSNIQMQGQLLPIPQMRLPQRGNIPFYGPGNSIIGYTDGNMQFYPAQQYTGAPNNQLNLLDKELLDNPEMLQRYVLSRDNYKFELGGVNIHPAMRTNFKQGGYYGMDGKLHRAKGSGTYVMNGGYYFDDGGASTTPPVASPATPSGAMGDPAAVPQSSLVYNNKPNPDGTFNVNNDYDYYGGYDENDNEDYGGFQTQNERALKRQARRQERRNTQYETPDLGGLDESQYEEQPEEEVTAEPFDASNYSSAIDPSTGFTKWSKNNQALTNIKKQDPALWGQLKNEGKGARFRTGQTDIQKFARTAGKIGSNLEFGVNLAGAVGNLLNNRNEQRNLNNAAINQGSTASMYTNPQGAGKGDYGQTGSSYGSQNPYSVGARSFKGMYGKYGIEVPRYDIGGFVPQLATLSDVGLESMSPETINVTSDYLPSIRPDITNFITGPKPIVESTGVYRDNTAVNQTADNNTVTTLDPDFALQSMAQFESGSKPGQAKVGMPTSLVGEGGKKASASGTFQITTPTLKDIFNNDKDISSKYGSFNKFKSAFDTDSKVEYEAARSLMARHIKNYGIYALGAWYYPEFARRAAAGDKSVFDIVPRRDFGNRVKWGDDFNKKLNAYNKLAGTNYTLNTTFNTPKTAGTSAVIPTAKPAVSNYSPSNTNFSLKGLIDFAKTNKWVVTSTTRGRHNPGSRHKKSRAIDVSVNNKTPQQILDFMKLARSKGYRVLDERVRPKGQKEWHGAHLHLDFKKGGQFGGQVMEMDEDEIKQFLKAGGQLEFLD